MIFADSHGEVKLPLPSLLGAHQIVNAGNAIAALSLLEDFDVTQGACYPRADAGGVERPPRAAP